LERKITDRYPLDMALMPEAEVGLRRHCGLNASDDIYDYLGVDIRRVYPSYTGPSSVREGEVVYDQWGVGWVKVRFEGDTYKGAYDEIAVSPLADAKSVDDVLSYSWPDPDWWDYDSLKDMLGPIGGGFWIASGFYSVFERAWHLLGMERLLTDLVLEPDIPLAVFDKILDFYTEQTLRILRAGGGLIDQIDTCDDIGSQRGMLLSPNVWREHIKPRQARFNSEIKRHFPVAIQYHCCGSMLPVIDDLIEIGVDILDPVQTRAADMDPVRLKADFGDRLCFHGGVDTQHILPYGSASEVTAEVEKLVSVLGDGGGYIIAPTHTVQADVPPENILAMCNAVVVSCN
jgi:uroporphyrinogen decarboxylase